MKIGDTVSVLDENIMGKISKINGEEITMDTTDGFELTFFKKELVVMDINISKSEMAPRNISEIISEKESKKPGKTLRKRPKERAQPPMEVDLHINQLVKSSRGLEKHDMLNLQLETAKRQLEFAIKNRIQRVIFIHGIGEGKLRAEMEYLFNRYENLKFYDADYQKYGQGATEVYIFQNAKP